MLGELCGKPEMINADKYPQLTSGYSYGVHLKIVTEANHERILNDIACVSVDIPVTFLQTTV
jgi:hypothetical protein